MMGNHGICDFPSSRRICRMGLTPHVFTDGDSEAKEEEYCVLSVSFQTSDLHL